MKKKRIYTVAIVVAILAIIVGLKFCGSKPLITFETSTVKKGTVRNIVTATGTIQAIKTVQVGTQVSGVINKLYADFNSHVKKGQLLAELDKKVYLSQLQSAQANLDNAKANIDFQQKNFERFKALIAKGLIAQTDFDQASNSYDQAKAALKNAQSAYSKAQTDLSYTSIYSPIDGIILNRAVDEGQTVAASFSTPTLFSIANDLTQMQVEANIDEADIGQVVDGQNVSFTVDAFPDRTFTGLVTEIRLQPTTVSNVVTYTVIVKAPNPDEKLMPGMTANISIVSQELKDVLIIPSKALRFAPDSAMMVAYNKSIPDSDRLNIAKINGKKKSFGDKSAQKTSRVWVKNGLKVHPVIIETGLDDQNNVQIVKGLKLGDEAIISMSSSTPTEKGGASGSPFMPKRPSKK